MLSNLRAMSKTKETERQISNTKQNTESAVKDSIELSRKESKF